MLDLKKEDPQKVMKDLEDSLRPEVTDAERHVLLERFREGIWLEKKKIGFKSSK